MNAEVSRPQSSIPPMTGYLGLLVILLFIFYLPHTNLDPSSMNQAILFMLVVFGVMAAYELFFAKTYKAKESGIDFSQPFNLSELCTKDFALKLFGLLISFIMVATYFFVADIYQDSWYRRFFDFIFMHWKTITTVVLAYFVVIHLFMRDKRDSYWHLGAFFSSFGKEGDRKLIRDHLLALAIKAFFLPLMFCYFLDDWYYIVNFEFSFDKHFEELYPFLSRCLFFIDLTFVVIGYVFTARLFNAHIRWTERKWGGWVVCLLCYMPFWQIFGRSYFSYGSNTSWATWLYSYPTMFTIWGSIILLLSGLYVVSEAHFGLRFSNLTYRGLISHGLFRFTKHPAYISKNISWWMIDVPFMAADWTQGLRNCLALLGINVVYFLRARYEEKCLSEASEYREYMRYIDRFGIFSKKVKKNEKK